MPASLKRYLILFAACTIFFASCSKKDGGSSTGSTDNYTEPALNATDTWVYMTSPNLSGLYPNNYIGTNQLRPADRKWISMHTGTDNLYASSFKNTPEIAVVSGGLYDSTKNSMSFSFENDDKFTRFCTESLNPGGREVVSVSLMNFDRTPGIGTYTITHDIPNDYKIANAYYDVFKTNGQKHDSTSSSASSFLPSGQYSTFTITSMVFLASDPSKDLYKMSGTATLLFPYIFSTTGGVISGTSFTLNCVFNNIPISYYK
jgi:hypothetical protein